MSIEQNKKLAADYLRAIEEQDADRLADFMTDDGVYWIPGAPPVGGKRNKAETREFFLGAKQILRPGFKFTVLAVTAEEDRVCVQATGIGKSITDKVYDNTYHLLFKFRDGKIYYLAEHLDTKHVNEVFSEFF